MDSHLVTKSKPAGVNNEPPQPEGFLKNTNVDGVDGIQRKVLLVEDTRINRVCSTHHFIKQPIFCTPLFFRFLLQDLTTPRFFLQIILRKVLQNLNLECDEAENGQIAVDLHKQGNVYDLVLMDKEMPVMDGHEATRQLRSMGVKTPIVALTGNALTTDRELFFEAGVDDFQTKVSTASFPLPFNKDPNILQPFHFF